MKKILLFLIVFSSCNQNTKTIQGDLYFKLVHFTSPEGMTAEEVSKIEKMLDSTKSNANPNDTDKAIINYFEKLRVHKLLACPFIKLRTSSNKIKTVFLSTKK